MRSTMTAKIFRDIDGRQVELDIVRHVILDGGYDGPAVSLAVDMNPDEQTFAGYATASITAAQAVDVAHWLLNAASKILEKEIDDD